jgi:hypothetical protein
VATKNALWPSVSQERDHATQTESGTPHKLNVS